MHENEISRLIVDNKAKEAILPIDKLKLRTYLRLSNLRLGLLINFHAEVLKDGITRIVNGLTDVEVPVGLQSVPDIQI